MKKRIYEVAKTLDVKSKEVIEFLQNQGFKSIKVPQNAIGPEEIRALEKKFGQSLSDEAVSRATTEPSKKGGEKAPAVPPTQAQPQIKPQSSIIKKTMVSTPPPASQFTKPNPVPKVPIAPQIAPVKGKEDPKKKILKIVEIEEDDDDGPDPIIKDKDKVTPVIKKDVKKTFPLKGSSLDEVKRKKGRVVQKRRHRRETHEIAREAERQEQEEALKRVKLPEAMTVKDLAEVTKIPVAEIIKKLFMLGVVATINQRVERSTLQMICDEYQIEVEFVDDSISYSLGGEEYSSQELKPRHPVVTILGHVDHGKTTLLDTIRMAKVVETEDGGITQHIGAYTVDLKEKGKVTFLDTPGHEAFTAMRSHGATITDIVVLVVAADDGVMPQTIESISHAQAAGVPLIVAINKIDKAGANVDKIKQSLTAYGLTSEEWGGQTIFVEISALKRTNIDALLDMILLQAEMLELKAPIDCFARGVVIESRLDRGKGVVATVLIQSGTLQVGDNIIAGMTSGRVKLMSNQFGQKIHLAGPATAVEILGLDEVPESGDKIYAVESTKFARQVSELRQIKVREQRMSRESRVHLDNIFEKMVGQKLKNLNIVLKADTQGSLLALKDSLEKLSNEEVRVKILHNAIGGIKESDVMLAAASDAIIIGFHVRPDSNATELAEKENVEIQCYRIIYQVIETIQSALRGMYAPQFKEEILGKASVRETFKIHKTGTIAGCFIDDGKITKDARIRVVRNGIDIYEGIVGSLRRFKDTVKEVKKGFECGVMIDGYGDVKAGDTFECFTMVQMEPVNP